MCESFSYIFFSLLLLIPDFSWMPSLHLQPQWHMWSHTNFVAFVHQLHDLCIVLNMWPSLQTWSSVHSACSAFRVGQPWLKLRQSWKHNLENGCRASWGRYIKSIWRLCFFSFPCVIFHSHSNCLELYFATEGAIEYSIKVNVTHLYVIMWLFFFFSWLKTIQMFVSWTICRDDFLQHCQRAVELVKVWDDLCLSGKPC